MKEQFEKELDELLNKYNSLSFEDLADTFEYYAARFAKYKEMYNYLEEYTI